MRKQRYDNFLYAVVTHRNLLTTEAMLASNWFNFISRPLIGRNSRALATAF